MNRMTMMALSLAGVAALSPVVFAYARQVDAKPSAIDVATSRPDYGRMTVEALPDGSTVLRTHGQAELATVLKREQSGRLRQVRAPAVLSEYTEAVEAQRKTP